MKLQCVSNMLEYIRSLEMLHSLFLGVFSGLSWIQEHVAVIVRSAAAAEPALYEFRAVN